MIADSNSEEKKRDGLSTFYFRIAKRPPNRHSTPASLLHTGLAPPHRPRSSVLASPTAAASLLAMASTKSLYLWEIAKPILLLLFHSIRFNTDEYG